MARRPSSFPASFAVLLAGALMGGSMLSWTLFARPIEVQLPLAEPPSSKAQPQTAGSAPRELAFAARNSFLEALERPLFSKTRRPSGAKVVPELAVAELSPDGLSISGITIIRGHARAFILSSESPKGVWFSEGSTVAGWRLTAISPTGIRLEAQGRSAKLELYKVSVHAKSLASNATKASPARTAP